MNFTPNVAVSRDCFSSLFKMPRARQEKVLEFIRRFSERPDSPGINFEKIRDAKDKKLRSVRIDDAYRGIVLHPESGNTYVLLWVDHHDDAYAWARNRSCAVNPYTGSLQIFEVCEEKRAAEPAVSETPPLFAGTGDPHQRIYRHPVVLSHCGISVAGRSCKLLVNYRTTEETRRWAVSLLDGRSLDDLEGGEDDLKGYRSLLRGQEPRLEGFGSFDEEADFLVAFLKEIESKGERLKDVCLVVRSRALLERYREALAGRGLPLVKLEAGGPENRDEDGVRTATMHRVKGLEFDRMILAGVCEDIVPPKSWREHEDPPMMNELETRERSLIHVAATRARTHILVTWYGEPSPLLGLKSGRACRR